MNDEEFRVFEERIAEKRQLILSMQLDLLDKHLVEYPWGIACAEFSDYLLDLEIEGSSINDEFDPLLLRYKRGNWRSKLVALKKGQQSVFIKGLMNKLLARKRAADYFTTPKWNDFIDSFLSRKFIKAPARTKGMVTDSIVGPNFRFVASDRAQLWARLFLEIEEDSLALRKDTAKYAGYAVLKLLRKGPMRFFDIKKHYSSLRGDGVRKLRTRLHYLKTNSIRKNALVDSNLDKYKLTLLAEEAFEHVKTFMGTKKDVRNWKYRHNIIYPKAKSTQPKFED